jgi:hypothetical protein
VEYEGVKKQKHYTFGVVDRAGNSLIRVSTVLQGDAQRWMSALQASRDAAVLVHVLGWLTMADVAATLKVTASSCDATLAGSRL